MPPVRRSISSSSETPACLTVRLAASLLRTSLCASLAAKVVFCPASSVRCSNEGLVRCPGCIERPSNSCGRLRIPPPRPSKASRAFCCAVRLAFHSACRFSIRGLSTSSLSRSFRTAALAATKPFLFSGSDLSGCFARLSRTSFAWRYRRR